MLARALSWLLAALFLLAVATYTIGELVPGAVLYTRDTTGEWVATKLWVVEIGGTPWVRVARPERAWYRRLRVDPHVELERDGVRTAYTAVPRPDPATRAAIDAAFRAQDGWVDWWFGLLLRKDAIPVELTPAQPASAGPERRTP